MHRSPPNKSLKVTRPSLLEIKEEVIGTLGAQINSRLTGSCGEAIIGHLDYSEYHGEISVLMIKVDESHRRHGAGSTLIKHLQSLFPTQEIDFGFTTEAGRKLLSNIKFIEVATGYQKDFEKLSGLEKQISYLNKRIETESSIEARSQLWDEINPLIEESDELEDFLFNKSPTKHLVDLTV